MRVREAPDTPHRAEIVVEGPVLLHQKDDVLDVVDGTGPVVGRDGQCLAQIQWKRRGDGGGAHRFQERTTVNYAHGEALPQFVARCCPLLPGTGSLLGNQPLDTTGVTLTENGRRSMPR
jgi:hypothetical protein